MVAKTADSERIEQLKKDPSYKKGQDSYDFGGINSTDKKTNSAYQRGREAKLEGMTDTQRASYFLGMGDKALKNKDIKTASESYIRAGVFGNADYAQKLVDAANRIGTGPVSAKFDPKTGKYATSDRRKYHVSAPFDTQIEKVLGKQLAAREEKKMLMRTIAYEYDGRIENAPDAYKKLIRLQENMDAKSWKKIIEKKDRDPNFTPIADRYVENYKKFLGENDKRMIEVGKTILRKNADRYATLGGEKEKVARKLYETMGMDGSKINSHIANLKANRAKKRDTSEKISKEISETMNKYTPTYFKDSYKNKKVFDAAGAGISQMEQQYIPAKGVEKKKKK